MSPAAATLLVEEVMPIITATVPRVVKPVGAEDAEELVQDTLCSAAQMVEAAEKAGKPLYPSSIAFYAIQRAKTGRRALVAGRTDAMSPAAQMDRSVVLDSMDEVHEEDGNGEETLSLHDLLASPDEDPSQRAGREIDWSEMLPRLSEREFDLLVLTAEGGRLDQLAARYGVSNARICQLRRQLGERVHELWGASALEDATQEAAWMRNNIRSSREMVACRRERWSCHTLFAKG